MYIKKKRNKVEMLCISFEPALKTRGDPKTYNTNK